ncbi:MAG TPA: TOPRIM nucleotidyl transferase/hydrolase domain-containing protein [Acidimicrobiia bacterium]|nr:TOPRIM nucleotidyl transferase/hydrolase domain-containing protein [Acidimicrobiia bacterium]
MRGSGIDGYVSGPTAATAASARALDKADRARAIFLVEGISDQIAVETLARRLGGDLESEDVVVVPVGGADAVAGSCSSSSRATRCAR